jgi:hypothetical protein
MPAPPPPVYVTVPPAEDVDLVWGQEVVFQSMQQNWTICFATNNSWPALSGKSFSNQNVNQTAPNVDLNIGYNVVTSGTCSPASVGGTAKTIHVSSVGRKKK